jgi:Cdc6-like AAA superfamily ATPase
VPVQERMPPVLLTSATSSGRASTGIPGLDDILGGGLTPDRLYLVEGTPGTGKTTLALQFLMEGVRLGVPALYITLSEQPMSCAPSPNLTVGLSTAYRCSSARAALRCVPVKYSGTKSRAVVARLTRRR